MRPLPATLILALAVVAAPSCYRRSPTADAGPPDPWRAFDHQYANPCAACVWEQAALLSGCHGDPGACLAFASCVDICGTLRNSACLEGCPGSFPQGGPALALAIVAQEQCAHRCGAPCEETARDAATCDLASPLCGKPGAACDPQPCCAGYACEKRHCCAPLWSGCATDGDCCTEPRVSCKNGRCEVPRP